VSSATWPLPAVSSAARTAPALTAAGLPAVFAAPVLMMAPRAGTAATLAPAASAIAALAAVAAPSLVPIATLTTAPDALMVAVAAVSPAVIAVPALGPGAAPLVATAAVVPASIPTTGAVVTAATIPAAIAPLAATAGTLGPCRGQAERNSPRDGQGHRPQCLPHAVTPHLAVFPGDVPGPGRVRRSQHLRRPTSLPYLSVASPQGQLGKRT
jgi:hypothetical protein